MPLELGVWRIDDGLQAVEFAPLELEAKLEDILDADISIADPKWMIVGRQVATAYGKVIDLLAIDPDGALIVIELKRDKTYRDVVAQVLDYGSWVKDLRADDVAQIYAAYRQRFHKADPDVSIDQAFHQRFGLSAMPDELAESHQLVIVAAGVDPSTERVVQYLAEQGIDINVVFFRAFRDDKRHYLARAWLIEPTMADASVKPAKAKGVWNGEFYCSYGLDETRVWSEAIRYGYFSAGNGAWYSRTLMMLKPGDRIWVNVPGKGYVGVGTVNRPATPVDDFVVPGADGQLVRLIDLDVAATKMARYADDPEKAEYLVGVEWIKTVPVESAIHETGFFGNQNSVARPVDPSWEHTVLRLKKRFELS